MVRAFTKFDGSGTRSGKRTRFPFANRGHVVTAPVGPVTYLYDTFNGSNGATIESRPMNVGPGWVILAGNSFTLSSGKAVRVNNAETVADAGVADGVLTCNVVAPVTKQVAGIAFRMQATKFGYWYTFDAFQSKLLKYSGSDGDGDIVATLGTTTNNVTAAATIMITLSGSSINIACTTTATVINVTDTTYMTQTKHGLTAGATGVSWDNFKFASA